jgi:ABC-type branched-subunit amino acid transport system ATPase component
VSEPLLQLTRIERRFRGLVAVDGVDLEIRDNEFVGIIGPNGAGKSTLLNMVGGQLTPTKGSIRFDRHDITSLPPHRRARIGIARTFQDGRSFALLTAEEAVKAAAMNSLGPVDPLQLLFEVGLEEQRDRLCGDLAYAEQKRVEVARALALQPRLLLLDEPFSGLSRQETADMVEQLRAIAKGRTLALLLVEHVVRSLMQLCDRVVVMHMGSVIADGTPSDVRRNPRVLEVYLGNWEGSRKVSNIRPEGKVLMSTQAISVKRGNRRVLQDVTVEARSGEVRCLLGANGAGKTSLLEALGGFLPLAGGQMTVAPDTVVRLVHQSRGLFPRLTTMENLQLGAYGRSRSYQRSRLEVLVGYFPWLPQRLSQSAGSLSGGEQQMLAIARSLMVKPSVLLVDEPSIGLAPIIVERIGDILRTLADEGVALLVSEQSIEYVLDLSVYGYILEQGRIIGEGPVEKLRDEQFVQAYLGPSEPQQSKLGARREA